MDKIEILIVGTNKPIMETIARLIDQNEKWLATIAFSAAEAFKICSEKSFGLALICAGLNANEEQDLVSVLGERYPNLPITMHYGGGSGLLFAEIYQGLSR